MKENFFVYIMTNDNRGTLYTGITSNLIKRVYEHKNKLCDGFTEKYSLTKLVHYEIFKDAENAIEREKVLKKWNRIWKIRLIENSNKDWKDLYDEIIA
ncbi:MAG: GIY-YIG nuclease family protein [Endomicrobia bacterium]|nr:GIY-YIG nuclease family protein [Endomicrobiia bacterium]MCL2506568.1 GIY-YIG nuclease family protein [Endomicrobiia bacterium]MCL2506595.1 GIY-YIG nuclease family protein [Endomicrobiia bacterium]